MSISRHLSAGVAAIALVGTIGLVYAQTSDERAPQTGSTDLQTMPAQDNTAPMGTATATQDRSAGNGTSTASGTPQATAPDSTATGSTTNSSTSYPNSAAGTSSTMPSDNSYNSGAASQEPAPKPDRN